MTKRCEKSEKWLERYLQKRVKETGGLCLKYSNPIVTGFPDRLILYPGGVALWAEIKSLGKEPTPLQLHRLRQLQQLEFRTWVCDTPEKVEEIVSTSLFLCRRRKGNGSSSPTATRKGPSDG